VLRSRPRLCLTYAKTLFMVSSYTTMERWLQDAEMALRATVPAPTSETAETGAQPPPEQHERDNLFLDEALDLALQGIRLSEQTETIVALYLGYTLLMRVYLARGEMDAARLAFQRAEEALTKTYSPYRRNVM